MIWRHGNEKWTGNEIGNEGAKSIAESLKINTSLTELYLHRDGKIRYEKERRYEGKMKNEKVTK